MFLLTDSPLPPEFFTAHSMTTLLGATGIVVAICGGIQSAFNYNPRWLGLAISILVTVIGTILSKAETGAMQYVIGVLNGFLVYASSSGATQVIGSRTNAPGAKTNVDPPPLPGGAKAASHHPKPFKRGFFSPWW